ncbi:hypothetical protein PspLS_03401 [Pyricularia sp. CBS 133598]|nr:hypothetical protein PspLS_03401 [Pyricularia sp. CBS 133598]
MRFSSITSVAITMLGFAAAKPTESHGVASGKYLFSRSTAACDCDGVRGCCINDCNFNENCCNTTCMDRFPECYNAC